MRILLSDLTSDRPSGLRGVLLSLGHDVDMAADPARPAQVHVVRLPSGMHGAADQIARIRRVQLNLPLLACGPWHEPPQIKQLIEAGADDYLPLPCETGALAVRLQVVSARQEVLHAASQRMLPHQAMTLTKLAGRIAHEYNNMLSAVQGNAELALLKLSLDSQTRYSLEQILNSSRRAADLTKQLQDLARVRAGDALTLLNLGQLIRESADVIRLSACRNCRVVYELDDAPVMIRGRASRLRQLLVALVLNASQALGESGGVIRIRAYSGPPLPDRQVSLEVEATAPGGDSLARSIGRGLGMTAVRAIACEHGGRIDGAQEGSGLIRISFPAPRQDDAVTPPENGFHEPAHPGTVLLIEDEDNHRMAAHRLLRDAGYVVFESATGEDALEVFGQVAGALDAVILDFTLPGMDTREAIAGMRRVRPELRMVVCSNLGEETARKVLAGIEDVAYVDKPVKLDNFVAVLQRALAV